MEQILTSMVMLKVEKWLKFLPSIFTQILIFKLGGRFYLLLQILPITTQGSVIIILNSTGYHLLALNLLANAKYNPLQSQ